MRETRAERWKYILLFVDPLTEFVRESFCGDARPMQLDRRRRSVIASDPEESVYVTSPEDTILARLEWYRMGGEVR